MVAPENVCCIAALVAIFMVVPLEISNLYISEMLHNHNPHMVNVGRGDLSFGWYAMPKGFIQDECDVDIWNIDRTISKRIATECDKHPVLDARGAVQCKDVDAGEHNHNYIDCYESRPCQNDLCKYNCKLTTIHFMVVKTKATPRSPFYIGKGFNVSFEFEPNDISRNDDEYLPKVSLCDYKLADGQGSPDEFYISKKGTYWHIVCGCLLSIVKTLFVPFIITVLFIASCYCADGSSDHKQIIYTR